MENKFFCFLVNLLHDFIFLFFGCGAILGFIVIPTSAQFNLFFKLAVLGFGLIFIFVLIFTYISSLKFDKIFKEAIISDNMIDTLYSSLLSFLSAKTQVRFNTNRALMYMRAIFLYKSTKKSFRYPWFKGYDFREHATWFDKILAFGTPIILFSSIGLAVLSFFVK